MKAKFMNASRITILLFAVFLFLGTSAFAQNRRRVTNSKTVKSTTAVSKKDTLSGLNNVINNTGSFDSNTQVTGQGIDATVTISPGTIPPVSPPSVVTSTNTSSGNDVSVSTSTTTSSGNTVNTTESGSSTANQPPKKKKK
ncbi:MAG: hypothetical protein HOO91_15455 [Bacteroidales bacterium]|nr:hypothetical protein [Bacteroidales bacterium]